MKKEGEPVTITMTNKTHPIKNLVIPNAKQMEEGEPVTITMTNKTHPIKNLLGAW